MTSEPVRLHAIDAICAGQWVHLPSWGDSASFLHISLAARYAAALDWGSGCPDGWTQSSDNCCQNSSLTSTPDIEIAGLHSMTLGGSATAGGNDTVVFTCDTEVWSGSFPDSVLDISSVWNKTELNVVGDAGGSRANFNGGSSVTVSIYLFDGSNSAPQCVANNGTAGESNNLNLGTCSASSRNGFLPPSITFTESN